MAIETRVKEYKNRRDVDADAQRMGAEGWRIVTTTERTQRRSCLGIVLTGGLMLLRPPKPHIIVTYQRDG